MKICIFQKLVLVPVCLLLFQSLPAGGFQAGTARVEISPPVGYAMAGYAARQGVSTGLHDPLYATVLVLKTPETSLALITADIVTLHSQRVEEEVRRSCGIEHVLLSASHTHSGPLPPLMADAPAAMRDWWRETEDKLVRAVQSASDGLFPARVSAGTGVAHISHNRRKVLPSGEVVMFWRNAEKAPTSPVDPSVRVLRVDDAGGNIRAVVVNHSCHTTVLGPDNLLLSADYVGPMRTYVEEQAPGAVCLFAFGASGDINPYFDKQPVGENPFEKVRWTGETLGKSVLETLQRIAPERGDEQSLRFRTDIHRFRDRWDPAAEVTIAMGVGLINGNIGFVTVSADPFVEHQIRLRDLAPCHTTFFLAFVSTRGISYGRYLPTIQASVEGGYGAGYATRAEVGAGERLVNRALVRLLEFTGKLSGLPGQGY